MADTPSFLLLVAHTVVVCTHLATRLDDSGVDDYYGRSKAQSRVWSAWQLLTLVLAHLVYVLSVASTWMQSVLRSRTKQFILITKVATHSTRP